MQKKKRVDFAYPHVGVVFFEFFDTVFQKSCTIACSLSYSYFSICKLLSSHPVLVENDKICNPSYENNDL